MNDIYDFIANDPNIDPRFANKFKTIKYSTQHLFCFLTEDLQGQQYYQIWEKDSKDKPVAMFIDMKHKMQLNNDKIPVPETEYIYFDEMCEIIKFLSDMEG